MQAGGTWRIILASLLLALCANGLSAVPAEAKERAREGQRFSPKRLPVDADISPLPNYKGDFVSLGLGGDWRKPRNAQQFLVAGVGAAAEPVADCSTQAIVHYAAMAPSVFEKDKKGLLYGVETHTPATRVWKIPGFNSCALVVYAIMKRAGCDWVKYTASAKALYDNIAARGWRPSDTQRAGCLVAWNSRWKGDRERLGGAEERRKGGTLFRHLGITTGSWLSVDNTSALSRPSTFLTWRPYRYETPTYLCPPLPEEEKKAR
jgi:hypothetical protein